MKNRRFPRLFSIGYLWPSLCLLCVVIFSKLRKSAYYCFRSPETAEDARARCEWMLGGHPEEKFFLTQHVFHLDWRIYLAFAVLVVLPPLLWNAIKSNLSEEGVKRSLASE